MSLHLIIDGYNLIRQSDALRPLDRQALELGRNALIDRLAAYKKIKRHKITIVFDGSQTHYFPDTSSSEKGIGIRFSRHGETADALIKKMTRLEREKAIVVSADRDVIDYAAAQGAATVSAEAFEEKLMMAEMMDVKGVAAEAGPETGWAPTTKKKGPGKRLPKTKRRNQKKVGKL